MTLLETKMITLEHIRFDSSPLDSSISI